VVLVALPVWGLVSHRLDKRRALKRVFAWQAVAMATALLLPVGRLWPLVGFVLLRGAAAGSDFLLLRAMVADVSGRDAEQGLRRSGSYYALFNVTLLLTMSLGVGMAAWLLALAGFVPGAAAAGAEAQVAIRLVYALPACLSALAAFAILSGGARPALSTKKAGDPVGSPASFVSEAVA
jgi:glycoside/pentoside/hexuronide:cation symporter, GPH family